MLLTVLEARFTEMRFFPAAAAGGAAYLTSLASPVPDARFCPTGGLTPTTAPTYLSLANVGCVAPG
jgi:2-dehydro-3-deoxyphosphogluconate aldolase / (4S)-4-hydroxy-2-oxoglutarate aldolase